MLRLVRKYTNTQYLCGSIYTSATPAFEKPSDLNAVTFEKILTDIARLLKIHTTLST